MDLPAFAPRMLSPLALLAAGLVGGMAARAIGLPMPFMIGSLAVVGAIVVARFARTGQTTAFPQPVRRFFVGVIGALIGARFTPALLGLLPDMWISALAMGAFVLVAQAVGFAIYRGIGRYDRVTAFYAAMPGGLIEAVSMGEAAGGDARILSIQHFARIVLVVVLVPLWFLASSGTVVGSAAGQAVGALAGGLADIAGIAALSVAGIWLGPRLRLPASHLTGPLLLSVALHASDLAHLATPQWLVDLSQLVVGTGLGVMFAGATLTLLARAFGLGALTMLTMLALALGLARVVAQWSPLSFETLFIAFAPGGVTEMGLIALSLGITPMLVTAHHLLRIGLTVVMAAAFLKRSGGAG